MRYYSQYCTIAGVVTSCDLQQRSFSLRCRNGDLFDVRPGEETSFPVLTNLDNINPDRVDEPHGIDRNADRLAYDMRKYVRDHEYLVIECSDQGDLHSCPTRRST